MNKRLIIDEGHRNPMSLAESTERMRGWLASEYEAVLFDCGDQVNVGYALYRYDTDWVYLRQLFVATEHRRQGVGKGAMAWLIANAWPKQQRVRLDLLIGNPAAVAFWHSMGFEDYCITMEREIRNAQA